MSGLVPFTFEGRPLRAIDHLGAPWFVAADVCRVLDIQNPTQVTAKLDADERAKLNIGRQGEATIVNESGLWALVLRSRKATTHGSVAHRLRKWVTAEVLPTIRRTGSYTLAGAGDRLLNDPAALRDLLLAHTERAVALEAKVEELSVKADAFDRLADTEGLMNVSLAAKNLKMQPKALFSYLREHGWIYRRPNSDRDIAYQKRIATGFLEHKLTTYPRRDGSDGTGIQVLVTTKGLTALAKALHVDLTPPPTS